METYYEDGYFIAPAKQPRPYQKAAEKLRQWQAARQEVKAMAKAA